MYESLKIVFEEGLEKRWKRHEVFSKSFIAAIQAFGWKSFPEEGSNAHTLSVPIVPKMVNDVKMRTIMKDKYQIIIAGGLGKLSGKTIRVGHMGNHTMNDLLATIGAMEMALYEMGHLDELGKAVTAMMEVFISN
jgi:aspartate aminotransferase-like enzyme